MAKEFSQKYGVDYDQTFCPVVIRTLISLSVNNRQKLYQMDITITFLNGDLDEEIYMKQPEGFEVKGQEHLVCKLKRSIYVWVIASTKMLECYSRCKAEEDGLYSKHQ